MIARRIYLAGINQKTTISISNLKNATYLISLINNKNNRTTVEQLNKKKDCFLDNPFV